jgi:hypothetical protein
MSFKPSAALLFVMVLALMVAQSSAVEVRLKDGTVLEAEEYTLTGSFLMLTLSDGRQVAYDLADVDLEYLEQEEPTAEPEATPEAPTLSQGRQKLSIPPEQETRSGLAITDQDVAHIRPDEAGQPGEESEEPGGVPEGYQQGGRVTINNIKVTPQGENRWLVEGEVINRRPSAVINIRVQLQTVATGRETPWSGEVAVANSLEPNEKGVFQTNFSAPKPAEKPHPDVRAAVIWMEREGAGPQRPPASQQAPQVPGGGRPDETAFQ